jgi:hypothetical protein
MKSKKRLFEGVIAGDQMINMLELNKSLIEPIHWQTAPNESIQLGNVSVQFSHKGMKYEETTQVSMRFLPNRQLLFVIPGKEESKNRVKGQNMTPDEIMATLSVPYGVDKRDWKLLLKDRDITLDVLKSCQPGHGTIFKPTSSVVTVTPKTSNISTAIFHLFNFPDFVGPEQYVLVSGKPPLCSYEVVGRSVLKGGGWIITIAGTDKTDAQCKALEEQGGYVITHMGEIRREDGSAFSNDQLEDLLKCLDFFLYFVLGCWSGVSLPVGFDKTGQRVFEQWGLEATVSGPWNTSYSWFDEFHGELLSQVFPGFLALWNDATWKDALRKSIYWYLGANQSGMEVRTEGGLILAQTALELLAWTYFVQHSKKISAKEFEGFCAAEQVRRLASALDIPMEIPAHLSALHSVLQLRRKDWKDAMGVITGLRNRLVHPNLVKLPDGSFYQAWELSLWYLEMVILRLCGHMGAYSNRLASPRRGGIEPVPWTKSDSEKQGA